MSQEPLIWGIRHGQSVSNAGMVTVSPATSALTQLGRMQAEALAERFERFERPPDLIVHSVFVRTVQTARPTMRRFPNVPVEVWPVQEYTYLDSELYAGTTSEERRPAMEAYWKRCDPHYLDGDGESFVHAMERANEVLERFQAIKGFAAVFSHGKFLRLLSWMLLTGHREPTAKAMRRFGAFRLAAYLPNAGVWAVQPNGAGGMVFGGYDVSHLPKKIRS
ncbi:MAG: histidine phosphatase family protein [Desulfovibrio sp.]|uniref:histidine phosphatase family protein n=1 Tax=Desulfovibrio sp. 7SRBS1 TaxID=3378064 RepID=UPI003B41DFF5